MTTIADGVSKELRYKRESEWSVPPGATDAQLLRRVTSDLSLRKQTYRSNQIARHRQMVDMRHGVRSVEGTISDELSPGTHQDFFRAAVRQAFGAAATTGPITDVTAQAAGPQYARGSGSFIADGFHVYDVVRWAGFAGGSAPANNARNFLITGLTATEMTGVNLDGSAVVADAAGDSVTCTLVGKKTYVPASGHLDDSFFFEHWYSDIAQSERFAGCRLSRMDIALPPTGLATIGMQFIGRDMSDGTSEYYTSPAGETTTGITASVNGTLYLGGSQVALLTGLSFSILENLQMEPVAGSNLYPKIAQGRVLLEGQATVLFEDATIRDYFVDEQEVALAVQLTTSPAAAADVLSFVMPRIKIGGADKDDGEKSLIQTLPFVPLKHAGGTGILATTISMQDSQAA